MKRDTDTLSFSAPSGGLQPTGNLPAGPITLDKNRPLLPSVSPNLFKKFNYEKDLYAAVYDRQLHPHGPD